MHTDDSPTSPTMPGGSAASRAIRASPLHRGEACLTCRRRKMKCDAGKPHCGPCSRAGKADECEYEETRFLAQITRLEDENARLQERIRELEGGFLQHPPQQQQQFTAFLPGPGPGRRSPSDAGSSGGQPSPYGQSAPLLVQHQHPHMSPYHQHQHAQYDQLPNIVTQQPPQPPQHQPQMQDWSSPGGLALQDAIQPHILQRLMHIFTRVASAQFGLPQASTALLASRRGSGALQEAACAAACVFARPNNGMAAYEAVFLQRASLALARPSTNELQDVQAGVILAILAFVGGRTIEAQRHLGGALRVARALRLEQGDADGERRETWWMLRRAERAWAPVVGDLGLGRETEVQQVGEYVKQEYSPYGVPLATLDGQGAQLAAHAWALVGDAQSSTAGPNFWHDVHSTTSALERLASISTSSSPSTTVVLHAAQCLLQAAVGARDKARACALRVVAGVNGNEVEGLDAVVGWWIVQVRASGAADDGALERAVERARAAWAYVGALRI